MKRIYILIFRQYSSYLLATWAYAFPVLQNFKTSGLFKWRETLILHSPLLPNRGTELIFPHEFVCCWLCSCMSLPPLHNQNEMLIKSACFYSQKDEPDAFKELGTGNRIATWLFYVSDIFLSCASAKNIRHCIFYTVEWFHYIFLLKYLSCKWRQPLISSNT